MSWFWASAPAKDVRDFTGKDVYEGLPPELKSFAKAETSPTSLQDHSKDASGESRENTDIGSASVQDFAESARYNFKTRKAMINSGALFNCALAESELNECFRSGSWWDKAKLCEIQKAAFWDCLDGNKKALTNLGYGELGNTDAQNESLLDKADELYLRIFRNEKHLKAEERPIESGRCTCFVNITNFGSIVCALITEVELPDTLRFDDIESDQYMDTLDPQILINRFYGRT